MRTLSLGLIALMLLLPACSTRQVITDASTLEGNPLIVVNRAKVETCVYGEALKPNGCGTEWTDVTGWAVMPRPVLARILSERERALAAVEEASAAMARRSTEDAVRLILARECADDPICKAKAAPRVARILEGE